MTYNNLLTLIMVLVYKLNIAFSVNRQLIEIIKRQQDEIIQLEKRWIDHQPDCRQGTISKKNISTISTALTFFLDHQFEYKKVMVFCDKAKKGYLNFFFRSNDPKKDFHVEVPLLRNLKEEYQGTLPNDYPRMARPFGGYNESELPDTSIDEYFSRIGKVRHSRTPKYDKNTQYLEYYNIMLEAKLRFKVSEFFRICEKRDKINAKRREQYRLRKLEEQNNK